MFEWKCRICDGTTLQSDSEDILKAKAREHAKTEHREELERIFINTSGGDKCRGGCGYRFPRDSEEHPGFECPDCGENHFNWFDGKRFYAHREEIG